MGVCAWKWDGNQATIKGTSQGKVNEQCQHHRKMKRTNILDVTEATKQAKLEIPIPGLTNVLIVSPILT